MAGSVPHQTTTILAELCRTDDQFHLTWYVDVLDLAASIWHASIPTDLFVPSLNQAMTILAELRQNDDQFHPTWYVDMLYLAASIWHASIPIDHFVPSLKRLDAPSPTEKDAKPPKKPKGSKPSNCICLSGTYATKPDFINTSVVLELVDPLPPGVVPIATILARLPKSLWFPGLQNDKDELRTLCFGSCIDAPNNTCHFSRCFHNRTTKSIQIHIDFNLDPWKSKPEAYWSTVVDFLQQPAVHSILRPSAALQKLTPGAKW